MTAYRISEDGKSITCTDCNCTSHNPHDVQNLYCGYCHKFHDNLISEFDCSDCGRHIHALCGPRPALDGSNRCAACMSMPGWFNDAELARMIDPDIPLGGWKQ